MAARKHRKGRNWGLEYILPGHTPSDPPPTRPHLLTAHLATESINGWITDEYVHPWWFNYLPHTRTWGNILDLNHNNIYLITWIWEIFCSNCSEQIFCILVSTFSSPMICEFILLDSLKSSWIIFWSPLFWVNVLLHRSRPQVPIFYLVTDLAYCQNFWLSCSFLGLCLILFHYL